MKTLSLLLFFVLGVPQANPEPKIAVELFSEASTTMPVVTLHDIRDTNEVVVRIFYWTTYPGVIGKIVLSKVSVVSAFEDVRVATDSVPVTKDEIYAVEVTLVKDLKYEKFNYRTAP